MWKVVIVYSKEIELDKTFNSRQEAEERASKCSAYYSDFGGIAMVWPAKAANKLIKRKGR